MPSRNKNGQCGTISQNGTNHPESKFLSEKNQEFLWFQIPQHIQKHVPH